MSQEFIEYTPTPTPTPEPPMTIFEAWMAAVTKPGVKTFARIASQPNATLGNALLWVAVSGLITSLVTGVSQSVAMRTIFSNPEFSQYMPQGFSSIGIGTLICGVPLGVIGVLIGFLISAGLVQWVAKMFGGTGTFDKLAYTFSVITVPISIITAVLSLFAMIPFLGILFSLLIFPVSIYALVLEVQAVQAAHGLETGKAAGAVLLPMLVFFVIICCCIAGSMALIAPMIRDTFNQINQGLY